MIAYEDDCVGCEPSLGCLGDSCSYRNVKHFYCDRCGEDLYAEELGRYRGRMYCEHCAVNKLNLVWDELEKVDDDDEE